MSMCPQTSLFLIVVAKIYSSETQLSSSEWGGATQLRSKGHAHQEETNGNKGFR